MNKNTLLLIATALAVSCGSPHTPEKTKSTDPNSIAGGGTVVNTVVPQPQKNWRVQATQAIAADPTLESEISPLTSGGDAVFQPTVDGNTLDPNFMFQVGAAASGGNVMLTYGGLYGITGMAVQFEQANETVAGQAPTAGWATVETQLPTDILMKFVFTPVAGVWYRVTLHVPAAAVDPNAMKVNMVEMGLYDLGGPQAKDYWVMTGASLEVQSFLNFTWKAAVAKAHPGYDSVLFNEAVGGWASSDLLKAMPGILAKHPLAKYIAIDIGGNDVNYSRPYPGGAALLSSNLTQILTLVTNAGMVPVLGRLTYRAYPTNSYPDGYPVPPSDNGSGPYVTDIVDPLIKQYCPRFYDVTNDRGLVDGYDLTLQNPNYLLSDGIHFTPSGAAAWETYWVQTAGSVVYK